MDAPRSESSHVESKRTQSVVCIHFSRIPNTDSVKCNYCGQMYAAHPTKNEISSLVKHIKVCKKFPRNVDSKQKTLLFKPNEIKIASIPIFTTMTAREFLAKMIILDEFPLKLVQGIGFRTFCQYLNPKFIMPSRFTVARDIRKIYQKERTKLKERFFTTSQRVCLTIDTWTSIQNLNYMMLTCHYVDEDWHVQKKILNFCLIPNHKDESIGKEVEKCLLSWEIENITTITVDNVSSNDVAISYLTKTIRNWKGLILNGDHMHVRCFAHVLNLIVSDGLKEHHESIARIRKVVKYVRSSSGRLQQFKACVDAVKITCKSNLSLDVPTHWNSTYLMLASAEKYEKAFEKLAENDSSFLNEMEVEGLPTSEDWSCIREYIKFLEIFHTMTLRVSASQHITANMYVCEVCNLKIAIETYGKSDNFTLRRMTNNMEKKFNKYWGSFEKVNMLVYVALVLDPTCKTKFLRHCLSILFGNERAAQYAKQVDDELAKLYTEYKGDTTNEDHTPSTSNSQRRSPTSMNSFAQVRSSAVYSMFYGSSNFFETNEESNTSEIDLYLSEKLEKFSDSFDILFWWKRNSDKYRVLSTIAKDILIIPISTVASESAFSCGGRVLDVFRSSLSPQSVEALICSQSWLKTFNPFKISTSTNIDDDFEDITMTTTEEDLANPTDENFIEVEDDTSMT